MKKLVILIALGLILLLIGPATADDEAIRKIVEILKKLDQKIDVATERLDIRINGIDARLYMAEKEKSLAPPGVSKPGVSRSSSGTSSASGSFSRAAPGAPTRLIVYGPLPLLSGPDWVPIPFHDLPLEVQQAPLPPGIPRPIPRPLDYLTNASSCFNCHTRK